MKNFEKCIDKIAEIFDEHGKECFFESEDHFNPEITCRDCFKRWALSEAKEEVVKDDGL